MSNKERISEHISDNLVLEPGTQNVFFENRAIYIDLHLNVTEYDTETEEETNSFECKYAVQVNLESSIIQIHGSDLCEPDFRECVGMVKEIDDLNIG